MISFSPIGAPENTSVTQNKIPEHRPNCQNDLECVRIRIKEYLQSHNLTEWFSARAPIKNEPFYTSIDIRDAGFKLAPVDANLYPAGFNNVCDEDLENSGPLLKSTLINHLGRLPQKIAILPESHTRNRYYADNLQALLEIFRRIGIAAEIGWWADSIPSSPEGLQPFSLQTTEGKELKAYPFWKQDNKLLFAPFEPDFILVNNDFSSGLPKELLEISQPVEPSPRLGWHTRKKNIFFEHYNRFAGELAQAADIDPWRLQVQTEVVKDVDFGENRGVDRIAHAVNSIIEKLQHQYSVRGIQEKPFVFVKNNSGTYGMGILRVESGEELLSLNRRERNKMAVGKNKLQINEVIVQEGIPTRFQLDGVYSEPVIYLLGHELLGGFLRKNPTRGRIDNLNSAGMVFQKLCVSDLRREADRDVELELVYGVIAQLSAAAVSLEIASISNLR